MRPTTRAGISSGERADRVVARPRYWRYAIRFMRHPRPSGFTYFLRLLAPWPDQPIKIGFSIRPASRAIDLACGNPYDLELVTSFPTALLPEKRLHQHFASSRLRGEWFSPTPELMDLIEAVRRVAM
jgi:hypothetical protein